MLLGEKLTFIGKSQTPLVPAVGEMTADADVTKALPAKAGGGAGKGHIGASKLSQTSTSQVIEISDNSDEDDHDKAPAGAAKTGRKRTASGGSRRKPSKDFGANAGTAPAVGIGQKRRRSNTGSSTKR